MRSISTSSFAQLSASLSLEASQLESMSESKLPMTPTEKINKPVEEEIDDDYEDEGYLQKRYAILSQKRKEAVHPNSPRLLYAMTQVLVHMGEYVEALDLIQLAYENLSDSDRNKDLAAKILLRKAMILRRMGRNKESMAVYDVITHNNIKLRLRREYYFCTGKASTLAALDKHEEALVCLLKAEILTAEEGMVGVVGRAGLMERIALTYHLLSQRQNCLNYLVKAAYLVPEDEAITEFMLRMQNQGNLSETFWWKGDYDYYAGNLDAALKLYQDEYETQPSVGLCLRLSAVLSSQQKYDEASRCLYEMHEKISQFAIKPSIQACFLFYKKIGDFYKRRGALDEAVRFYEMAKSYIASKKQFGKNFESNAFLIYLSLGRIKVFLGDHDGAKKYFEQALSHRKSPSVYLALGDVYAHQEKLSDAIACFEDALAISSDDTEIQKRLDETRKKSTQFKAKLLEKRKQPKKEESKEMPKANIEDEEKEEEKEEEKIDQSMQITSRNAFRLISRAAKIASKGNDLVYLEGLLKKAKEEKINLANLTNGEGISLLALPSLSIPVVRCLRTAGARLHIRRGMNPVHFAAIACDLAKIKALLGFDSGEGKSTSLANEINVPTGMRAEIPGATSLFLVFCAALKKKNNKQALDTLRFLVEHTSDLSTPSSEKPFMIRIIDEIKNYIDKSTEEEKVIPDLKKDPYIQHCLQVMKIMLSNAQTASDIASASYEGIGPILYCCLSVKNTTLKQLPEDKWKTDLVKEINTILVNAGNYERLDSLRENITSGKKEEKVSSPAVISKATSSSSSAEAGSSSVAQSEKGRYKYRQLTEIEHINFFLNFEYYSQSIVKQGAKLQEMLNKPSGDSFFVEKCKKMFEADPRNLQLFKVLASRFFELRKDKEIISLCDRVILADPLNQLALYWRSKIYSELGDFQKALSDYNKFIDSHSVALQEDDSNILFFMHMSRIDALYMLGMQKKALALIEEAAHVKSDLSSEKEAQLSMARAKIYFAEAKEEARKKRGSETKMQGAALEEKRKPNAPFSSLDNESLLKQSLVEFNKVITMVSEDEYMKKMYGDKLSLHRASKAQLLFYMGNPAGAAEELAKIDEAKDHLSYDFYITRAHVLFNQRKYREASKYYNKALAEEGALSFSDLRGITKENAAKLVNLIISVNREIEAYEGLARVHIEQYQSDEFLKACNAIDERRALFVMLEDKDLLNDVLSRYIDSSVEILEKLIALLSSNLTRVSLEFRHQIYAQLIKYYTELFKYKQDVLRFKEYAKLLCSMDPPRYEEANWYYGVAYGYLKKDLANMDTTLALELIDLRIEILCKKLSRRPKAIQWLDTLIKHLETQPSSPKREEMLIALRNKIARMNPQPQPTPTPSAGVVQSSGDEKKEEKEKKSESVASAKKMTSPVSSLSLLSAQNKGIMAESNEIKTARVMLPKIKEVIHFDENKKNIRKKPDSVSIGIAYHAIKRAYEGIKNIKTHIELLAEYECVIGLCCNEMFKGTKKEIFFQEARDFFEKATSRQDESARCFDAGEACSEKNIYYRAHHIVIEVQYLKQITSMERQLAQHWKIYQAIWPIMQCMQDKETEQKLESFVEKFPECGNWLRQYQSSLNFIRRHDRHVFPEGHSLIEAGQWAKSFQDRHAGLLGFTVSSHFSLRSS